MRMKIVMPTIHYPPYDHCIRCKDPCSSSYLSLGFGRAFGIITRCCSLVAAMNQSVGSLAAKLDHNTDAMTKIFTVTKNKMYSAAN